MKTKKLVYCALFSAVIAVMSLIAIPTPPIPLNMALLAVLLAGGMLGRKYGTLSVVVYILLGVAGLPVFAGFRGGLSTLTGPTGGFIAGYVAVAFVTGAVYEKTSKVKYTIPFMIISVILCYIIGTMWYCFVMNTDFITALTVCVLPFIPGDVLKIVLTVVFINKFKLNKKIGET